MLDFETAFPSVSRNQLYLTLHEQGIQGKMLSVLKSLTKAHYVRVLHPDLPEDSFVEIERGLAEGSALSPRLFSIFLGTLLRKLKTAFLLSTCQGHDSRPWIGGLAYVDDLCLCSRCPEELNKMITFTQQWAEDNGAKINYGKEKSEVIVFNETPEQKKERGHTVWAAQARHPHRHAKVIHEVNFFRYLGFTLYTKMDMDIQCTQIIKKIKILRYSYVKSTTVQYFPP